MKDKQELKTNSAIARVIPVLEKLYGIPEWKRKNPLDELILTIISQNTNDKNRDNAYNKLRDRFPNWSDVKDADVSEIESTIRSAGLSKQKSARIKAILQWISDSFGKLSIDAISNMSNDEAISLLTSQKGIGVKTAAVVLAFAFDRDLCPVDTHVHRISIRLGWVEDSDSAEATFNVLQPKIPENKAATFHLNLLKFGRNICTARSPKCDICPFWTDCTWENKLKH